MSQIERAVALLYPAVMVKAKRYRGSKLATLVKADCPAASAEFADGLVGFRPSDDENLIYFEQRLEFPAVLRQIKTDVEIESRLRLVGRCVKHACPHWMGSCVLGHTVTEISGTVIDERSGCSISESCRWRKENGAQVCKPCGGILNLVVEET